MKTALVYVSKYGATEKCAGKLAEAAIRSLAKEIDAAEK